MSRRLVIAVDCDDVLVPGTEFTLYEYNRRWNTSVPLSLAHTPGIPDWGVPRGAELQSRFDEIYLSDNYAEMKPYQDAVSAIRRLAEQHELHMVTARPETIMGVTERMIEKYFPDCFTSLEHVGLDGSKGSVCEVMKADVLIDDNYRHLATAKDCDTETRIWFGNYPWQIEQPDPGVVSTRCDNWGEVEVELARLAA